MPPDDAIEFSIVKLYKAVYRRLTVKEVDSGSEEPKGQLSEGLDESFEVERALSRWDAGLDGKIGPDQ